MHDGIPHAPADEIARMGEVRWAVAPSRGSAAVRGSLLPLAVLVASLFGLVRHSVVDGAGRAPDGIRVALDTTGNSWAVLDIPAGARICEGRLRLHPRRRTRSTSRVE